VYLKLSPQLDAVLNAHIQQSANGIAVLDEKGRFLFCNQSFARMFGCSEVAVVGATHVELKASICTQSLLTDRGRSTLYDWLAALYDQQDPAAFRSKEVDLGNGSWVLLTHQVYAEGGTVVVCADISRTKKAELALISAHAELQRQATTDALTGIPNRRHFFERLEAECERFKRYGHPMCVAMMDLDHFKRINDGFGHAAGDTVLRHFALQLNAHVRAEDIASRIGGEEFALLLPETEMEGAVEVTERLRRSLAAEVLDTVEPGFQYTFSAGVAMLPLSEGAGPEQLMREADEMLYAAKRAGRNRTTSKVLRPA